MVQDWSGNPLEAFMGRCFMARRSGSRPVQLKVLELKLVSKYQSLPTKIQVKIIFKKSFVLAGIRASAIIKHSFLSRRF